MRRPYSGPFSPGDGITAAPLSHEPLATEGEATPGPDDYNPFTEVESVEEQATFDEPDRGTLALISRGDADPPPLW